MVLTLNLKKQLNLSTRGGDALKTCFTYPTLGFCLGVVAVSPLTTRDVNTEGAGTEEEHRVGGCSELS